MVLGLSLHAFTVLHVIISLIGIVSGIVVLFSILAARHSQALTFVFLLTTVLTSVTGFFFPAASILPSHVTGILSLILLALAIVALYIFHLSGAWRWIYVVCTAAALYFNAFVAVVQAFQKVAFLQPLAPTQSEPPFVIAQLSVVILFLIVGFLGVKRFRPGAAV